MKTYSLNERYAWKKLEARVLVLDTHSGDYFVLNGSASEIWQGLIKGKDHGEIVKDVCKTFMVLEEEASIDVNAFIESLTVDGIVTCREKGGVLL